MTPSWPAHSGERNRVVVPDDINGAYASSPHLDRLRSVCEVELFDGRAQGSDELRSRIASADAVLSFRPAFTRFPADVLGAASRLRLVCISGTGTEDVDVAAATARGVAVANVPGPSNRSVAELALALMLDVARGVSAQDRDIRRGTWRAREGIELGGRTLGLVGLSAIARELAPMARALGMRVVAWSRTDDPGRARDAGVETASFDEVIEVSDVVSVHARLNPETVGMIGREQFARMRPGAILINTARGGVVDEAAMIEALRSGRLRGAGLDVFATEPLPAGHPLLTMDNVVMTPVAGWNTSDASDRMIRVSIDNVVGFLAGRPANICNPDYAGRAEAELPA